MTPKLNVIAQIDSELVGESLDHRTEIDYKAAASTFGPAPGRDIGAPQIMYMVQRLFPSMGGAARQVVFCGVDSASGSSSVCARTAQTLAEHTNLPICVIDANPRLRRLSALFGRPAEGTPYGTSASTRHGCTQLLSNLWLAEIMLPSTTSKTLLPLNPVADQLKQLGTEFAHLLIDSPGVNVNSDAALLGQMAGTAVLIVEAGITRRTAARRAKHILDRAGVRLLGTVLHNHSFPVPSNPYDGF